MPPIARVSDTTRCPAHAKGRITNGFDEVLICFEPVARLGDVILCEDGSVDVIAEASSSVWIGGKQVAHKGNKTAHGGVIATGCPRVSVGLGLRNICPLQAARARARFIRYYVKKKLVPFIAPVLE